MDIMFSYFGWMVTRQMVNTGQLHLGANPEHDLLLDLWTGVMSPTGESLAEQHLLAEGMIKLVGDATSKEQIVKRYQRNPFEHLTKIIFEFTTICNFNCDHCYNAHVPRLTETRPELLVKAADIFIQMGIRRFDFIGGEGYGNLHENKLVDILNHFDQAFVYQLHAERRLKEYLTLVDLGLFGSSFTHLCTLRSIVTLLARKMNEKSVAFSDQTGIQWINREVALLTGHLSNRW